MNIKAPSRALFSAFKRTIFLRKNAVTLGYRRLPRVTLGNFRLPRVTAGNFLGTFWVLPVTSKSGCSPPLVFLVFAPRLTKKRTTHVVRFSLFCCSFYLFTAPTKASVSLWKKACGCSHEGHFTGGCLPTKR